MPERTAPLRILLADDHVTMRHGLRLLIDSQPDMKVVSEASDGSAAMQNALAVKPDVIVMDISMPGMNGLAATRALKQAHPGVVDSQFGLVNAVQRPQVTTLGREAYPSFPEKVAAFLFALLTYSPFRGGNRRVALAALFAFCELNNRTIDSRMLDEKSAETLFRRAAAYREMGIPAENVYKEIRETLSRAIVPLPS